MGRGGDGGSSVQPNNNENNCSFKQARLCPLLQPPMERITVESDSLPEPDGNTHTHTHIPEHEQPSYLHH